MGTTVPQVAPWAVAVNIDAIKTPTAVINLQDFRFISSHSNIQSNLHIHLREA
jgi:hypothetical protein